MTNYTKQNYERDLEIVADAPIDAKSVDAESYYLKFDNSRYYCCASKFDCWRFMEKDEFTLTRSLQDIRDKIAMYEANRKLSNKIQLAYEYLDSFLETEVNKENYLLDFDITVDNNVDFNEARIALEELTND